MSWLAPIGVLLAIVILVVMAWKGFNIVIIAPFAAVLIILTNGMEFQTAFFAGKGAYLTAVGGFITSYLPIFILGALLGKYLEDSKATVSIANGIFKLVGKDSPMKVMVAISIIAAVLTYGGISLFIVIFTVVALCRPIFKELNLPWRLVMVPMIYGGTTFTMTMVPGVPSIQNVIPTQLGTTLTAAPLMSVVISLVSATYGYFMMKYELKRMVASGETYSESGQVIDLGDTSKVPPLFLSILPMVVLIVIIFVGSAMKIPNLVVPALLVAVVLAALCLNPYIPNQLKTLNAGATNSLLPIIFTAAAAGVGAVVFASPGFQVLQVGMSAAPGGALTQIPIITGFISMVTASASGALGIVIPTFGQTWIAAGIDPQVVHRISSLSSAVFSAMPHSGFLFSCMAVFGVRHKDVYRQMFLFGLCGGFICLMVALLMAVTIY
ncbi:GntP family permease [Desulfitobacterium chlororespirans]|uniref:H+/gluconate symporter n=1 Tax=Desulfitobacterium chlororespirans DSM 11544 TaxID=1121395 RepID=A0A1M7UBN7_9FIRM|nr:GntP family permease [Desulfitobacterium chlororespirans]SHN80250.1 H+/gluconate symporter [Desulfitobacterium chlororespirans DSM 11544]